MPAPVVETESSICQPLMMYGEDEVPDPEVTPLTIAGRVKSVSEAIFMGSCVLYDVFKLLPLNLLENRFPGKISAVVKANAENMSDAIKMPFNFLVELHATKCRS